MTYKIGEIYEKNASLIPEYSWEEVKSKSNRETCWIVMHDAEVYDVTKFIEEHPGGPDAILGHCGEDAT